MGVLDLFKRKAQPLQTRSYEAASPARSRFNAGANRFSGYGPETAAASPNIRSRARHAGENNALVVAAVNAWIDSAIGPGIRPVSQHPDPETRFKLDAAFALWARNAMPGAVVTSGHCNPA